VVLHEVARYVPLDRLLIETDAPYLAPEPFRGKTNEPAFLKATATFLAALKGVSFEDLAYATAQNASALFRLPEQR
jgi:TatD DNase family protein